MNTSTKHILQCNQSEPLADASGRIVDLMNENGLHHAAGRSVLSNPFITEGSLSCYRSTQGAGHLLANDLLHTEAIYYTALFHTRATGPVCPVFTRPIFRQNAPFEMSNFEIFVEGIPPHPLDNPIPTHRSNQYPVATALHTNELS